MRTLTIVSLCLLVRWAGAAEPELKGTAYMRLEASPTNYKAGCSK